MPEHEESEYVSHPEVSTEEFMDRFGFNAQSTMFESENQARAVMGKLLERAESWFKTWTGWEFSEDEDIPEDKQGVMSDCIYARAAYFMYLRLSNLRWEESDHFRSLARMQRDEYLNLIKTLKKSRTVSRYILFTDAEPNYMADRVEDV